MEASGDSGGRKLRGHWLRVRYWDSVMENYFGERKLLDMLTKNLEAESATQCQIYDKSVRTKLSLVVSFKA